MRDLSTAIAGDPVRRVPAPPHGARVRHVRPAERRWGRRCAALAAAASLCALAGVAGASDGPSAGVLLRQARYALAANDLDRARQALTQAYELAPQSARGLEAVLLLAQLEFTAGDPAAAARALSLAQSRAANDGDSQTQLLLARGWLALASGDPATAQADFASVAGVVNDPAPLQLAAIGNAWADLIAHGTAASPTELRSVFKRLRDPALRVGAGLTLARLETAIGQPRRTANTLRKLRKLVRRTTYADDVEIAIAFAQLDCGKPGSARQTLLRLWRRAFPGTTAPVSQVEPVPDPTVSLTLADLRGAPAAFAARMAELYASRPERSEELLTFFGRILDRNAIADLPEALRLIDAQAGKDA